MAVIWVVVLFVAFAHFVRSSLYDDVFNEELLLKPLNSKHVYAHFQFSTKWNKENTELLDHFHLFPRALGEIVEHFQVQELHLSLTQGLWRHQKWGYPVNDAPPGAQLWVWFKKGAQDIDKTWDKLTAALAGLFCASLNFIDTTTSVTPVFSFRPLGVSEEATANSSRLRYATLPRETVCTENLTPWKKLLPCDTKRGLATLLNARHIYTANYHSLGVHLRSVCQTVDCKRSSLELTQTVSVVFDVPAFANGQPHWSLKHLFGMGLGTICPLASSSKIYVVTGIDNMKSENFILTPDPTSIITSERGGSKTEYSVYNVPELVVNDVLNIIASYKDNLVYGLIPPPVLYANSFVTGSGLSWGHLVTKIHNNYQQRSIRVVFLHVIPWFIRVYLHSLKIESNKQLLTPVMQHYIPGKDRHRPFHLELIIDLPPNSITEVSIEFERGFLKWLEYPPDANHGFYVGSAIISAMLPGARNYTGIPQDGSTIADSINASRGSYFIRIMTEPLLVSLPTPDFSMPYNVICLACTVVALAFGPMHNITTKSLTLRDLSVKSGIFQKMKLAWKKFCGKVTESTESNQEQTKKSEEPESGGEQENK